MLRPAADPDPKSRESGTRDEKSVSLQETTGQKCQNETAQITQDAEKTISTEKVQNSMVIDVNHDTK